MIPFEQLSDDAKLWSYQADRKLTETEKNWLREIIPTFLNEWAAHGDKLNAFGDVVGDYHIILAVDEDQAKASGCSIDSSVRFIKSVEKELNLSFFNRLKMLTEINGELSYKSYAELSDLPAETMVYNNTVSTVGAFKKGWKQAISELKFA